ncbi:MAG: ribonuclease E/G [Rhizobiaceae bacterium]|nr:ribonuclease E/G [Rhizobiaceae bacterium]
MPNKMLIDASHQEETRVVVVRGNRIEEFDFESQDKKQLKGNIYLARVTRVEPSLQAAFVEYGGNRHGFLAFSEIHPDYYQIPVADRQALLRAEAEAAAHSDEDEEDEDGNGRNRRRRRSGKSRDRASQKTSADTQDGDEDNAAQDEASGDDEAGPSMAESVAADVVAEDAPAHEGDDDDRRQSRHGDDGNGDDEQIESVGAEDAIEEAAARRRPVRKHYKIQEVIKRRQILLVQVVKEERGNKGAALTTYLSLAGRYSVLMPNTARGGGISRKITNAADRKRLKSVVEDLNVPDGMGVILRTAGESRTKAEIKRDYEYLMRMWENVRGLTLQSTAPALVYEEGSLIKRSIRDLYNKDIDQIMVAGEDGYREAKDFMRMLMPSHAKMVQPYRDSVPIFARNGIEAQLDKMVQPQVTLKSGGYVIINQTEALVAIDVNSGRSTREHSIEDTALQTNLEAAEEVARQLRLRDLAGLIVIDFIDMEENRNNRAVEKKLKDCLKNDRARIQVGRISHFGLLEMSRQRIRASVLDSTMQPCPHCGGTGHVRSESSVALLVVRAIEEYLLKDSRCHITVRTPASTALYVLNHKRATLADLERRFDLTITIEADEEVGSQHYVIARGAQIERPEGYKAPTLLAAAPTVDDEAEAAKDEAAAAAAAALIEDDEEDEDGEVAAKPQQAERETAHSTSDDGNRDRKKRRRRRRRGRDRNQPGGETGHVETAAADLDDEEAADATATAGEQANDEDSEASRKKRRRGKRGGRRNRREDGEIAADATPAEADASDDVDSEAMSAVEAAEPVAEEAVATEAAPVAEEAPKPKKARTPRKSRAKAATDETVSETAATETAAAALDADEKPAPKKRAPRRKKVVEEAAAEPEVATAEIAAEAAEPVAAPEPAPVKPAAPVAPLVQSLTPQGEVETTEDKPRRQGWWQRKGFF